MNMKISIIVPVYNAMNTIIRCVSSLLNQTYRDLEIILINDASTDDTFDRLIELERLDPERILIINSDENRGPGGARNIGLSYATGEYIGFVDSDDYVDSSFFEKLLHEMITGDHDMVDCGFYNEKNDMAILHTGRSTRGKLNDDQRSELIVSGGYLWSRLFRRELFSEHNVIFRENCILEDSEILNQMIAYADSIGAVEETLYCYTSSKTSASHSYSSAIYIENICDAMIANIGLSDKIDNYEYLKQAIEYEVLQMYNYGIVMALKDAKAGATLDTTDYLKRLRRIRLEGVSCGYENKYVKEKIKGADLDLMKQNDSDPIKLAHKYAQRDYMK